MLKPRVRHPDHPAHPDTAGDPQNLAGPGGRAGAEPHYKLRPALLVGAFCVLWLFNYPGRLNIDSIEMLIGAAIPRYRSDWHSPIIGWMWGLAAPLLGRPACALLIHASLLAFGCAVTPVAGRWNRWTIAAAVLETVWKIALVGLAGTISKDVLLISLLVAALAAFRLWLGSRSRLWLGASVLLLFLVAATRPPNAAMLWTAAALTLPFYAAGAKRYFTYLLPIGLALAGCVGVSAAANRYWLHAQAMHPEVQLVVFDLAGTSVYSGTDLFRQLPGGAPATLPDLRRCYRPSQWDEFAPWGPCRAYSAAVYAAAGRAGGIAMLRWWLGGLAAHPFAYAEHRAAFLRPVLVPSFGAYRPGWYSDFDEPVNSPPRKPLLDGAVSSRVPPGWFQLWRAETMPAPIAIVAVLAFFPHALTGTALVVCLLLLAGESRRSGPTASAGPVMILAAGLGIGNFAMMALFGASASPRYFFPLVLAAYIGVTEWLRLKGTAADASGKVDPGPGRP